MGIWSWDSLRYFLLVLLRNLASRAEMYYFCSMSTITIPLPEEDLTFLRAYSNALGTSAEEFLARQTRSLREYLQRPLQPEVAAASAIISPRISAKDAHLEHLEKKHS
jgi:hypothetical protein